MYTQIHADMCLYILFLLSLHIDSPSLVSDLYIYAFILTYVHIKNLINLYAGSPSLLSDSALRSLIVQKLLDILSLDTDNAAFKMFLLPLNSVMLSLNKCPEDLKPYSVVLRYVYVYLYVYIRICMYMGVNIHICVRISIYI
jgi:hypothetical protein